MESRLPTLAGFLSTGLFAIGTLPMLSKAIRTRNLASYSLGNMIMSNVGNVIYSVYVFQLPAGPVWFLHAYNLVTTAFMLAWYLRYERPTKRLKATKHESRTQYLPTPCCTLGCQ